MGDDREVAANIPAARAVRVRILGFVCLGIAEIAFVTASCLWFQRRGFRKGFAQGHEAGFGQGHDCGRINAEQWWMQAEIEVQKEREAIWMEEIGKESEQ